LNLFHFLKIKEKKMKSDETGSWFIRFAKSASRLAGSPATFTIAIAVVVIWSITGPIFGFSDTWQLVINTGTTIVTFLMVFLIQNTQNRDTEAVQIKLDELIRVTEGAHNALMDLEELGEKDISLIREKYKELAERSRTELQKGKEDTDTPKV
jgi:low affinity Fe/Cu permease